MTDLFLNDGGKDWTTSLTRIYQWFCGHLLGPKNLKTDHTYCAILSNKIWLDLVLWCAPLNHTVVSAWYPNLFWRWFPFGTDHPETGAEECHFHTERGNGSCEGSFWGHEEKCLDLSFSQAKSLQCLNSYWPTPQLFEQLSHHLKSDFAACSSLWLLSGMSNKRLGWVLNIHFSY